MNQQNYNNDIVTLKNLKLNNYFLNITYYVCIHVFYSFLLSCV